MGQGNPVLQLTACAKRLDLKAAPGSPSSGLTAGSTPPTGVEKEQSLELPVSTRQGHPELHPPWEGPASQQPWSDVCMGSHWDTTLCKAGALKGPFWQCGSRGTLPHLIPSHLVDRGSLTAVCPLLGSVIFDSLPSCTSCTPFLGSATEQTIAFLFLLLQLI